MQCSHESERREIQRITGEMPGRLFTHEKHRADQHLGESKENSFQGWFVRMFVVLRFYVEEDMKIPTIF